MQTAIKSNYAQIEYSAGEKILKPYSTAQQTDLLVLYELQHLIFDAALMEERLNGFINTLCTSLEHQFQHFQDFRNLNADALVGRINRFSDEILQVQQMCEVLNSSSQRFQQENFELRGCLQRMVPVSDFNKALGSIKIQTEENVNLYVEINGLKQQFVLLQKENTILEQSLEVNR